MDENYIVKSPQLVVPVLQTLARDDDKYYCEVCLGNCVKKNKKRMGIQTINKDKFKLFAMDWGKVDHPYNKLITRIDWCMEELFICKRCSGKFFQKEFLKKQRPLLVNTAESIPIEQSERPSTSSEIQEKNIRISTRKILTYPDSTDRKKFCIICKEEKKDKGRIVPLTMITLRENISKMHKAEETLLRFAKIHVKHNTRFKEAAERILLVSSTKSLFAADVCYHREECYMQFRGSGWLKLESEKGPGLQVDSCYSDPFSELMDLVNMFVLQKNDVFTLTSLKSAYESLNKDGMYPILRSVDIKSKLLLAFPDKIYFSSPTYSAKNPRNVTEYILPVGKVLTADCIRSATSGHGISDTVLMRTAAQMVHKTVQEDKEVIKWPPTPQEIIENKDPCNPTIYNHIAWIVNPNASLGTEGLVKLSKTKELKVLQIAQNIESLMPHSSPSLDQVLLSLTMHRKTGSSDVVDTLSRFGYGIPYTEVCFIEDKWAEWDEKQNFNIPSNIIKGMCTTHVADNIDWQNKNAGGKQTHNTNSILIQHECDSPTTKTNVNLQPSYDYSRKEHRAYKSKLVNIPDFHYVKSKCSKFSFNDYTDVRQSTKYLHQSSNKTVLWVLSRLSNKDDTRIPSWSGFQYLTSNSPALCKINVGYLPAITDSPTKYKVLYQVLLRSLNVMNELEIDFIFLVVDQAIYTKIIDLNFQLYKGNQDQFKCIIERMGDFHIIICMMRCIYSRFKGFGFPELLSEVGLGGSGTIENALKGGDVKEGIRFYKILFEAIIRIKIDVSGILEGDNEHMSSFMSRILEACDNFDSAKFEELLQLENFDIMPSIPGDMTFWFDSFLEMVDLLLNFTYFIRTGNWYGYMEAIYMFLPYCFSLNRQNYSKNLSYYYIDMLDLKLRNPPAYKYLEDGSFSGSLSGSIFSNIPMDQVIECTINRYSKSVGGLSGKTENVGAADKWVRLNHYLCALKEHMNEKIRKNKRSTHVDCGKKRIVKDEKNVRSVVSGLRTWVPNLYLPNQELYKITNGVPASSQLVDNARTLKSRGELRRNSFFERIVDSQKDTSSPVAPLTYEDAISREPLVTFADKPKGKKKKYDIIKDEGQSFLEILSRYKHSTLDLPFLMQWPVTSRPWAICDAEEKGRSANKSLFRNALQEQSPTTATNTAPTIHTSIVDVMRVIRIISISGMKPPIFLTWANCVCNYLNSLAGEILHLVFYVYLQSVAATQPSKGRANSEQSRFVSDLSQHLPPPSAWMEFLSNSENKRQVTHLLIDYILSEASPLSRKLYITKDFNCFLKDEDGKVTQIGELSSRHHEADPRIALHAVFASLNSPNLPICAISDDTDVFIILLYISSQMQGTLYFRQGTSSSKKGITYHNISALADHLGRRCCANLPGFHALTGSDFTFPFFRRSKYQIFKKMSANMSTRLLDTLGSENPIINDIIKFILYTVYNRPKIEKSVSESRIAMMFDKKGKKKIAKRSTKVIPPDEKSLQMKILRSNYIAHSWRNCLNSDYVFLDPIKSGWQRVNNLIVPLWYEGSNLPTDEEYNEHINSKDIDVPEENTDTTSESSASDSEDECPLSGANTSSSEDEL